MQTALKPNYSPHLYSGSDDDFNYDMTPVSATGENKKRLLVMALGIGLSIASPVPGHVTATTMQSTSPITCIAELTKEADEATNPSSEWEAVMSRAYKDRKSILNWGGRGAGSFNDRSLSALGDLVQVAEHFYGGQELVRLPSDAQDLLHQVWMDELSDVPLIPGMK